jgi:hypothetical protein
MANTNIESTTAAAQADSNLSQADFAHTESCLPTAADSAESPANAYTGPRTEAGKAVSSRNAVKHNLCSKSLTGADLEQFLKIRARFDEEWEPATETENLLLDQMALSQWRMDRALSLELNAFDNDHLDEKLLALALRYRTTAERSFYKALSELQRLRKTVREEAIRREKLEAMEREAAVHREMERLCFVPCLSVPEVPKSQRSPIRTDRSTVKSGDNFPPPGDFKSEAGLVTLCHSEGRPLFALTAVWKLSYAMKDGLLPIAGEKSRLI